MRSATAAKEGGLLRVLLVRLKKVPTDAERFSLLHGDVTVDSYRTVFVRRFGDRWLRALPRASGVAGDQSALRAAGGDDGVAL